VNARPYTQPPIDTREKNEIFLINFLTISGDSKHFSGFSEEKNLKNRPPRGPQILFFCELKPGAKYQNPVITPSGRKVTRAEEEREKKCR
jgi:hypothetical protein